MLGRDDGTLAASSRAARRVAPLPRVAAAVSSRRARPCASASVACRVAAASPSHEIVRPLRRSLLSACLLPGALGGCDAVPDTTHAAMPTPPVLVGAGDIAGCAWAGEGATARILDTIPDTVFTAGDNAYDVGTLRELRECDGPSWGRHRYEAFAPQTPTGAPDAARGIRRFTVGTGGGRLYPVRRVAANSEVRLADTFGVLRLDLDPGRYRRSFIGVDGAVRDAGAGDCH